MALGAIAAKATKVTDAMFLEAAKTLAENSPALKNPANSLFPPIEEVREMCRKIAIAVASQACKDGVAGISPADVAKEVDRNIWTPHYPKYTK